MLVADLKLVDIGFDEVRAAGTVEVQGTAGTRTSSIYISSVPFISTLRLVDIGADRRAVRWSAPSPGPSPSEWEGEPGLQGGRVAVLQ